MYLKFSCCAWVYILKFCHLKIASGAVDARKWNGKLKNWNFPDIFFPLISIEGRKQRRRAETFALCMWTMPSERAWQQNGFLFWKMIILTLVTLHVQEDFLGLMKIVLNTLIHNDLRQCIQELANVMNCDHSTIVRHFHSMGKVQKLRVCVTHALRQNLKSQRMAICACLFARHRLSRVQHRPFLSCVVNGDEKWFFMQ